MDFDRGPNPEIGALQEPASLWLSISLCIGLGTVALFGKDGSLLFVAAMGFILFEQLSKPLPTQKTTESISTNQFDEQPLEESLEMVELPGGTFTMGSDEYDEEKPPHKVL